MCDKSKELGNIKLEYTMSSNQEEVLTISSLKKQRVLGIDFDYSLLEVILSLLDKSISEYRKAVASNDTMPQLTIFKYTIQLWRIYYKTINPSTSSMITYDVELGDDCKLSYELILCLGIRYLEESGVIEDPCLLKTDIVNELPSLLYCRYTGVTAIDTLIDKWVFRI